VCNWVWGYSLTAGHPLLVPESCAYFWTLNRPDPAFLAETSSGCALGSCLEEAILYAILEVAERDAFLLTWHSRIPADAIDLEAADDREPAITATAITQATGYRVSLFDITTEVGIPCVWAMATHPRLRDGGLPPGTDELALFCAAGSHLSPERAALSALVELGPQLVNAIKRFPARRADAAAYLARPDEVRTIFDHAVAFGDPRAYERLGFLTQRRARSRPLAEVGRERKWPACADMREDLLEMVDRFRSENMAVIVVNQTAVQAGIWTVLGPATAAHTIGPAGWGAVLSAGAAGLFAMSAAMYRLKPRRLLRFGYLCLPFAALPLISLSFSTNVGVLCAASFIGGLAIDALNVSWATSLQTHVSTEMISRVSAIDNIGAFAAIPIGQIAASPVAAVVGATRVEVIGGLLFAAMALLPMAVPEVRALRQPTGGEPCCG
jgi:thiazole/oxazole-forming peptide maturase SagD family component